MPSQVSSTLNQGFFYHWIILKCRTLESEIRSKNAAWFKTKKYCIETFTAWACRGLLLRSLGIKGKSMWTYKMLWPSYKSIFQRKKSSVEQFRSPGWSSAQHEGCIHSDMEWKAQRMWDCPKPMLTLQPFTCKAVSQLTGSLTSPEWIKDSWPPGFPLWTDFTMVARLGKYKRRIWSQEEREKPIFYYKVVY